MQAEQPDLLGNVDPSKTIHPNNLRKDLCDRDGIVQPAQWLKYGRTGESIGDCRGCGGDIYPERPLPVNNNRTDYIASCRNRDCLKEVVFPNGRTGRWDTTLMRGKKRRLPVGQVAISKNAAGVGQSREDGDY